MYGGHAPVNNHSMGSILASSAPFGYNMSDNYMPVDQGNTEDICNILQQIINISSQNLDEAQMRFVKTVQPPLNGMVNFKKHLKAHLFSVAYDT